MKQFLKDLLIEAGNQLTGTIEKPELTEKAREKMEEWGVSEKNLVDVLRNGTEVKPGMVIREYAGYSIGLTYFRNRKTGKYVVTSTWKRP
jgi:hypothetical protein